MKRATNTCPDTASCYAWLHSRSQRGCRKAGNTGTAVTMLVQHQLLQGTGKEVIKTVTGKKHWGAALSSILEVQQRKLEETRNMTNLPSKFIPKWKTRMTWNHELPLSYSPRSSCFNSIYLEAQWVSHTSAGTSMFEVKARPCSN